MSNRITSAQTADNSSTNVEATSVCPNNAKPYVGGSFCPQDTTTKMVKGFVYNLSKELLTVGSYGVILDSFTCELDIFQLDKDDNIWNANDWGYHKVVSTNNPKFKEIYSNTILVITPMQSLLNWCEYRKSVAVNSQAGCWNMFIGKIKEEMLFLEKQQNIDFAIKSYQQVCELNKVEFNKISENKLLFEEIFNDTFGNSVLS